MRRLRKNWWPETALNPTILWGLTKLIYRGLILAIFEPYSLHFSLKDLEACLDRTSRPLLSPIVPSFIRGRAKAVQLYVVGCF